MKIITKYLLMGVIASLVGFGCDGGQIQFGPSVDGAGPSGISIVDPTGASIDGGEIDPTVPIIVRFPDKIPDVHISVDCDGQARPLNISFLTEDTLSAMDQSGRWPQKEDCILRLLELENVGVITSVSKAFGEASFRTLCGAWDYFDNPKSMDRTAASGEYGDGCWKVNVSLSYSWDRYNMVGGQLVIDVIGVGAEEFLDIAMLSKTINGEDYALTLAVDDFIFTFPEEGENESVAYRLVVGDWDAIMEGDFSKELFLFSYEVRRDGGEVRYDCLVGAGLLVPDGDDEDDDGGARAVCGDGTVPPYLGFDKQGSLYTPRYSLDRGETWEYFYDEEGLVRFEVESLAGEVDIAVVANNRNVPLSELFIDEIEVIGDAVFVK